jgi:hypothetical protein
MPEPLSNIQQQWLAVAADLTLLEPAPLSTETLLWLRSVDRNDTATWTKGLPLTVARFTEAAQQLIYERHQLHTAHSREKIAKQLQTAAAVNHDLGAINRFLFARDTSTLYSELDIKRFMYSRTSVLHADIGRQPDIWIGRLFALETEIVSGTTQLELSAQNPQILKSAMDNNPTALNELRKAGHLRKLPLGDIALLATRPQQTTKEAALNLGTLHVSSPIPPGAPHFSAFFRAWSSPS